MIAPKPVHHGVVDGNTAVAEVAYACSEVVALYPITPSSPMGELSDAHHAEGIPNLWGAVPRIVQMQSEGGAAGALHGALTTGSLATTFTASQGLLLMIPNMYKIAGELTAAVIHVAARTVAAQALSIFGDHSDVMGCRATGWAMLSSGSVQEAQDLALIAHAATLAARVPFVHFFDGFRTSHEVQKIELLDRDVMQAMLPIDLVRAHRRRRLDPDHPVIRGTAQNPDVFFQARESVSPYYEATVGHVRRAMDEFAAMTGRQYAPFEYHGHPEAERVMVAMGSGAEVARATAERMASGGERVGVITVRLFRPWSLRHFMRVVPETTQGIAVLDRCKEPGAPGEPLYQDVVTALAEASDDGVWSSALPRVIGGRYGLGSKDFNPAMVRAVFAELEQDRPRRHITIGIDDDVSGTSVDWEALANDEDPDTFTALLFGLGSDGTVGAAKNTIRIVGDALNSRVQGYFEYDSKKSGAKTISHLRIAKNTIRASYLIQQAGFVACHAFPFLARYEVLERLAPGGTFLLNSPYPASRVWDQLPREVQEQLVTKQARMFVIDAYKIARDLELGTRINVIMQAAMFAVTEILPKDDALEQIEASIRSTYGLKGEAVVTSNLKAARKGFDRLREVTIPDVATTQVRRQACRLTDGDDDFVRDTIAPLVAGTGDALPVSAMPVDGTWPVGTAHIEKRGIAQQIPVWDSDLCIQCNQCAFVCPHSAIRPKIVAAAAVQGCGEQFRHAQARGKGLDALRYTLQVAPDDCTGCQVCVAACPARARDAGGAVTERRALEMVPVSGIRNRERANWDRFLELPETDPELVDRFTLRGSQLQPSMFEFSGACAGCGETPYMRLLSQLFGDRMLIANATGCSSIFCGNLPTTPWTTRADGRGPAWSNSLFEDNAEFGMGMRLSVEQGEAMARELIADSYEDPDLVRALLEADCSTQAGIEAQRERVAAFKAVIQDRGTPDSVRLMDLIDYMVPRTVWIVGGDGWAYDIGFGGLDHVLASGLDVNVLVLDTAVYSNTGGQASKATPRGAVARFAVDGKEQPKKDLGAIAMTYGSIFVAQIAYGASMPQAIKALRDAESFRGPSLVIAYASCIAHGGDMVDVIEGHQQAVRTGFWPLYRNDPRLERPLQLDSKAPDGDLDAYLASQNRFRSLVQTNPERAAALTAAITEDVAQRWRILEQQAGI
ncbi:MAG: pyruvate:ferredoxin (flavodoxin) oxidoreductase [Planctomycetota bacterium]|jgi:pyruvate-ferredoxin/flavodoxin oxidoreductase|nr:pyruvate:ferredoxin (flavodoxin) oxidoreductase [Planctomycetota bacterium]